MKVKGRETIPDYNFLKDGGEAADIIASIDWLPTPLGSMQWWPQSLRTTLSIILHSKFPMFLFWGPELICFYNDAYRPSLGNEGKHPFAMGSRGEDVWPEIWHIIKPLIDQVLEGKGATWHEDQLIPIYRNGRLEDVYWTFSYSPVEDESGRTAGVFVTCTETTRKVELLTRFQQNQQKFLEMIEQAPMGIAILRGEQFIADTANTTYLQIVDRKPEDFLERPLFNSMPEVEEAVKPLLQNVLRTGQRYEGKEFPVQLNRHGHIATAFFNFTYLPLFEENVITGIIVLANDVTDLVEAKHFLLESEKKFRDAVTNSPIAIGIFRGRDLIIEEANETLLKKLWRREAEDVMGKKLFDAFPELLAQQYPALLNCVYDSGIPHRESEALAYVDSWDGRRKYYLDFEYAPLFDRDGDVSGIMITVNDVSEKVEARMQIADAEERARLSTEAGELGTFDFDMEAGNIYASPRFHEIFGSDKPITRDEAIGMILADDQPARQQAYEAALNDKEGRLKFDTRITWKDGSLHWIHVDGKFFFDYKTHQPIRLLGTAQDITEEKNAVLELAESEQHFRQLVQEAPIPNALLRGRDFIIEIANDAILHLWGRDSDIIGKPLLEVFPELSGQNYIALINEVYSTGITYSGNERAFYLSVKGEMKKVYINIIFKRLKSYQRPEPDILVAGYDVTEQVIARRKTEESERELQRINQTLEVALEAGKLGPYELEIETGLMNCTPRCKANFGLQPDTPFNLPEFFAIIIPQHKDLVKEAIEKAIGEHTAYNNEFAITYPDGSMHWIKASGKVAYDQEGNALKMAGVTLDITEARLAMQRIAESEQRLNMALEYTNMGSWDLNLQTFEIIYTPRLAEIFGYGPEGTITHPQMREQIHADDRKAIVEKAFSAAIKSGIYFYEARMIRADNAIRWIRTQGRVIYDADKIPVRMLGTIMDITEEKNEQQRKDEFMGIVTHELKTPLTSVKAFAEFLYERSVKTEDNTSAVLLSKMVAQINKLNLLVQDLLDVTRMEGGRLKFHNIQFNFNELVTEVAEQISITTTKNIFIENTLWNGSIIGDRERTGQVLTNLLTNAIKYSPDADRVIITIKATEDEVICSVTDFGIGIGKQHQPYIFDRFYRETESNAITFPGLGLGLYISSEILKRQGGKIWVESKKGKGSVFSFSLPLTTIQ